MQFESLGLSAPLLRAVAEQGYTTPSPIQQKAIPVVLEGRDLMAAAQTGTGKTAGFTLPMLQRLTESQRRVSPNQVRALVLAPTRELAAQVGESVREYGKHLPVRSHVVFGGVSINPQMMAMRRGLDVLVACPGRLLDLYNQKAVRFDELEILVLDEADRMLDMGFIRDIRKILALLPKKRQNLLFSATFADEIRELATGLLNDPAVVEVAPRNSTAERIEQLVHPVDKANKIPLLTHLVKSNDWQQVLVFTRTKHIANRVAEKLEKEGVTAAAIHGNKSQGARTRALAGFKDGSLRVLVATDIAARGLDIDKLPQVVNFELPNVAEDYVHRIGRTGRAGSAGHAISLVSADEGKLIKGIERLIKQTIEKQPVAGFEPSRETQEAIAKGIGQPPRKEPREPGEQRQAPRRPQAPRGEGQPRREGAGAPRGNNGGNRQGKPAGQRSGQGAAGGRHKPATRSGNR
ncbi:DEAD/DEAH box helicase [Aeromonas simiae]|uniref:DEAD/DEAH box helicase n=1 Tax=Aeromonas simiae TaxID=218936 RepID=UPI00266D6D7E|nr:DEAD/DEAH box helicase [Aeromonas simiae]MDO2948882.1 DEAD/DEAH box helicase [Aeromonas simiae]MDO2956265.1 DEAD/DEAH box helicase [Aeromonas simiae]